MEKRAHSLVFRRMTYADFRHINKVGGEEVGGGGQSYIDFPTKEISYDNWFSFLGQNTDTGAGNRPVWNFEINSFGVEESQQLKIYQRRSASFSIASQKIHSRESNRVKAWHPTNGFPSDYDHENQNLIIYIAKTIDNEYWAGWLLENQIPANWIGNELLKKMFTEESAGYLVFNDKLFIETSNTEWPFYFYARSITNEIPTADDLKDEAVMEDTSPKLQQLINDNQEPELIQRFLTVRKRNKQLVKNLKELYNGRCQITGDQLTFLKSNGELYSEVHHLIPLGEKGSDSYANTIVISPLIHRMLHYANVSEIDLSKINDNQLPIKINEQDYFITWHPDHFKTVEQTLS
ncbi:HNH endonuclease [Elizabethkingia anophelis]|uniref:HNH endonuclease n=1 Tax=Elizabethkingia anophelis TaxID=1117645 RepID=UPI00063BF4C6|nr:hypothetical protein [Elizabethkingia anophelis]AKH95421.1 hypothetical protein M876_12675 [Elizabethkingia anophelis FMS-007]